MDNKKYRLTDETISIDGRVLHRIEALRYFGSINKGDKGGFVESDKNLSHKGNCWIYDDACVYDYARVTENSNIRENAKVCGHAQVYNSGCVCGESIVRGYAQVYHSGKVRDKALVCDMAHIYGHSSVGGSSVVCGSAQIYDKANVYNCLLYDYVCVCGSDSIENVELFGDLLINTQFINTHPKLSKIINCK